VAVGGVLFGSTSGMTVWAKSVVPPSADPSSRDANATIPG
jgi:hypothetical protein